MLKEEKLVELLKGVKDNKLEDLEILHQEFFYFLKKYSNKFQIDFQMLEDEFNLILLKIIDNNLKEKSKILQYIKKSIINFKDKDKDELLRKDSSIKFISLDCEEYRELNESALTNNVDFLDNIDEFDFLNHLDKKTVRIIKAKFLDGYTCEELGVIYNMSKQGISKRINTAKKNIKEIFIDI